MVHRFYEKRFWSMGHPSPINTKPISDMLFITHTMFYTCLLTEVLYHAWGNNIVQEKRLKTLCSLIKKYHERHKISFDKLCYTYSPDTKNIMLFLFHECLL